MIPHLYSIEIFQHPYVFIADSYLEVITANITYLHHGPERYEWQFCAIIFHCKVTVVSKHSRMIKKFDHPWNI